jgi:hypothetical protein
LSGWAFPRIDELQLDYHLASQARAVHHLLRLSGKSLRSVTVVHSGIRHEGRQKTYAPHDQLGEMGYELDAADLIKHIWLTLTRDDTMIVPAAPLHSDVFTLLAYQPGLASINIATIPLSDDCLQSVLGCATMTSERAFAYLQRLDVHMLFRNVPSLVSLLVHSPLLHLSLHVYGDDDVYSCCMSIAAAFPDLESLRLYAFHSCFSLSDVLPLHQLPKLSTLSLSCPPSIYFVMTLALNEPVSDDLWELFLEHFPCMRDLTVRIADKLSPYAYRRAGQVCRKLQALRLNANLRLWDEEDLTIRHIDAEERIKDRLDTVLSYALDETRPLQQPAQSIVVFPMLQELEMNCIDRVAVAGQSSSDEVLCGYDIASRLRKCAPHLRQLSFAARIGPGFNPEREAMAGIKKKR